MDFEWVLGPSFQLRRLPLSAKADLCMVFHINGTFITKDDIVKLLIVIQAPQAKLQTFSAICLSNKLAVLCARLHPPELLSQPLEFAL